MKKDNIDYVFLCLSLYSISVRPKTPSVRMEGTSVIENEEVILVCDTESNHDRITLDYKWFKNEMDKASSKILSFNAVLEMARYTCSVSYKGIESRMSDPFVVKGK